MNTKKKKLMKTLEEVKDYLVENTVIAAQKAEEFGRISKAKIEIIGLKKKIRNHYEKIGRYLYKAHLANEEASVNDESLQKVFSHITALKEQVEGEESLIEELRKEYEEKRGQRRREKNSKKEEMDNNPIEED